MNKIQSILAYLCLHYPHSEELSKARITKLVYLADWWSALSYEKQITEIKWLFNHYGPYVDDIAYGAKNDPRFDLITKENAYGGHKEIIKYNGCVKDIELTKTEESILNTAIDKTKHMYFNEFIDFVYSTYPVQSKNRYSVFDLVALAKEYRDNRGPVVSAVAAG